MLKATSCQELESSTRALWDKVQALDRKEQSRGGPHSSPVKLLKTTHNCSKNTAAAQSYTKHWSPQAFQIPRQDGDEDEKGAVALKGNLGGTPWGVWVQEAVHRLESGRERLGDAESDLLKGVGSEHTS